MELHCFFCRVPIESVLKGHFFADGTFICQDCLAFLSGVTEEYKPRPVFGRGEAQAVHWDCDAHPGTDHRLGVWVVNPNSIESPMF